ncbi:MAG: helix-turn-helix transcriptional regulator [Verrucomicrobia bacterium]|nr:helix-turn-helix transcriptional regulator [Verrucomicrobiota bacterium]
MKITVTKEWFQSRAHLEEGHEIGAGSLRHIGKPALSAVPVNTTVESITFGKTIALMRRSRRWTIDQLASEAEATREELSEIESNPDCMPEPSTVFSLAKVFKVPPKAFMQKAGLADAASSRLHEDSIRYAACSGFVEPLTADEEHALQAVLKALVEHTEP